MRYLKKANPALIKTGVIWIIYLALSNPLCITTVYAEAIEIETVALSLKDKTYYLTTNLLFTLSEEVKKALEHGISLQLNIVVQVKQIRAWLWNKKVADQVLNYKLQYHPLSGSYLVTEGNYRKRQSFKILDDALHYIGTINNVRVFDKTRIADNREYIATMRAYLDVESLPAPMRPVAYLSSDWQVSSTQYAWNLNL